MKRILATIALSLTLLQTYADEGMWLPLLLGKQVYADMKKKGLKLTPAQLYNINKSSLKDAIIIFGNGCTGEIVSNKGLIFTNHHCGYDAIADASSVANNYLRDGFYAKNLKEEIKTALTVQFLVRIDDVTKEVLDSLKGLAGAERAKKQAAVIAGINKRLSQPGESIEANTSPLFKGNQFLVYIYKRYKDIRLVGAPPESVGKFGGDTDNWEWPRHTGDFSIFRVYTAADGQSAEYNENNIPLKPKYHLPVSLKGIKDGDFAMTWGYPGSTNRYESSMGIKLATDISNPTLVKLRDMRLKYMIAEMQKDAAVKIKLASNYASVANYWKFFDGETKQLLKFDVYGQKKKTEANFISWAKNKQEYDTVFPGWEKAYEDWRPYAKHRTYMREGIYGTQLVSFAVSSLIELEAALSKSNATEEDIRKAIETASAARKSFLNEHDAISDQKIFGKAMWMYYQDIAPEQRPAKFYDSVITAYGKLDEEATYQKYAAYVFANNLVLDEAKWNAFVARSTAAAIQQDPLFITTNHYAQNWTNRIAPKSTEFIIRNNEYARLYLKGIMEMDTIAAKKMYPDATFTMRVSYGSVKSYEPRDAVKYDYITTSKGLLQKYVPDDYEFDLPKRQVELLRQRDFGQYADKERNDLVIAFITTNDITGGNSGSPVIDGRGRLIGLAFDGNYEALSHKLTFDKDLNRTICVDIRYVLWCVDKLGQAKHLVDELTLVK